MPQKEKVSTTLKVEACKKYLAESISIADIAKALEVDGKIVMANDILTKKLGYLKEEILGKTTLELNIWKNKEIREEFVKNKEILENIELEVSKKNGENLMCLISINIINSQAKPTRSDEEPTNEGSWAKKGRQEFLRL